MPQITVFTSSHDHAAYLAEAIESVLAQTFGDFEYLLYDDGSTDATWEIMEDYARRDPRIRAVRLPKARNVGAVINRSLRDAKGRFWVWCPSDDVLLPTLLEDKLARSARLGHAAVLYSDGFAMSPGGEILAPRLAPRTSPEAFAELVWKSSGPIGFTGIWIPMRVFDSAGLFPEHLEYSEDYYWMIRATLHGVPFHGVEKVLYQKRVNHPESTFSRWAPKIIEQVPEIRRQLARYRDTRFAAGMLTAPRPEPTLDRALASLGRAGFSDVEVFDDKEQKGSWSNWIGAARRLLAARPEAEAYLLCEDDAVFCRGLREYLTRTLWPKDPSTVALCSPYSPAPYRAARRGWNRQDRGWYLAGSVCWALPRSSLEAIVEDLGSVEAHRQIDARVGRWAKDAGRSVWYHTPSLVQHLGLGNSALGDTLVTDLRAAGDFVGEETMAW